MNRFIVIIRVKNYENIWGNLFFFLYLIGCSDGESYYKRSIRKYFSDELITHLPEEIESKDFSLYFDLDPQYDRITGSVVTIYISYLSNNIDSILQSVTKESIGEYLFSDSCNTILYRFQRGTSKGSIIGKEWLYEDWIKTLESQCTEIRIPIPNYINAGEGLFEDKYGISDDYTIYVMEAKKGIHFPEEYYAKELILPDDWKRGYSKGYAINRETCKVIFWFTIW